MVGIRAAIFAALEKPVKIAVANNTVTAAYFTNESFSA
jgi:hypothetical protein